MIFELIAHQSNLISESLGSLILITAEESLEMIGTIFFSFALLKHIKETLKLKYLIKI